MTKLECYLLGVITLPITIFIAILIYAIITGWQEAE